MSLIEKLRKLPDDKKKMVSAGIALFLTIIIAGLWFAFGPKKNNNSTDLKAVIPNEQMQALKDSFQKSIDQFHVLKDQIMAGTSTSSASTTTSTTTKN